MAHLYSTAKKLELANGVIAEAKGDFKYGEINKPIFKHLYKLEKKYRKNQSVDLNDFCIPLSELPLNHFKLMVIIGWLDMETEKPKKHLKGFYRETFYSRQGLTQIEHYMTVDTYINLLFIELSLKDLYVADGS